MRLRIAVLAALACALAGCGDSNVEIETGQVDRPAPGTFRGSLGDGDEIEIEVGSIEAIAFRCGAVDVRETFSPPEPIETDGTFDVSFADAGRRFHVRGTFRDRDHVDGTIDDADDACDDTFEATRAVGDTRTPTPSPGGTSVGVTPRPGDTPTVTPSDRSTVTPTPTDGTPTATPSVKPTVSPCPIAVEVLGNAGAAKVLDTGWTGIAHNATVIGDGTLTFSVTCDRDARPCGTCALGGPLPNAGANRGDLDSRRCADDTSIACTRDAQCPSGVCAFFFGAPLPLSAGGASTCVVNQVKGSVTGSVDLERGDFASTLNLSARVFLGDIARPCPRCDGDATLNDGVRGGTCGAGPRLGQPCDGNGRSAIDSFGTTSLDCPPNPGSRVAILDIALAGSSGTETRTLSATDKNCTATGATNAKCFCHTGTGEPTRPNACLRACDGGPNDANGCDGDDECAPGSCRPLCRTTVDGDVCVGGPVDGNCKIESFSGCQRDADCPAPGDQCVFALRPCYLDNGAIGGSVTAEGRPDPPTAGGANPTFASLFCIPPVGAASVNSVAGLPGLGRIELPLITQEIMP